jgi:hypothetical protein
MTYICILQYNRLNFYFIFILGERDLGICEWDTIDC